MANHQSQSTLTVAIGTIDGCKVEKHIYIWAEIYLSDNVPMTIVALRTLKTIIKSKSSIEAFFYAVLQI